MKKKRLDVGIKIGMGAIFNVKKIDKDGNVLYETGPFHNIMTQYGIEYIHTISLGYHDYLKDNIEYVVVGTGTSTPSATQQELDAKHVASNNVDSRSVGSVTTSAMYGYLYQEHIISVGNFNGETITEVGISTNGTDVINRQLLPSPVTVASDEGLIIESELRVYPGILSTTSDSTSGTFNFEGSPYRYTLTFPNHQPLSRLFNEDGSINYYMRGFTGRQAVTIGTENDVKYVRPSWSREWINDSTLRCYATAVWNPGNATGTVDNFSFWEKRSTISGASGYITWEFDLIDTFEVSDLEELTMHFYFDLQNR